MMCDEFDCLRSRKYIPTYLSGTILCSTFGGRQLSLLALFSISIVTPAFTRTVTHHAATVVRNGRINVVRVRRTG